MKVCRMCMYPFKGAHEHLQMEKKCIPNVNWVVSLYVNWLNKTPCVVCDFMKLMVKPTNDIDVDEGWWSSDYLNFLIYNRIFDKRIEKWWDINFLGGISWYLSSSGNLTITSLVNLTKSVNLTDIYVTLKCFMKFYFSPFVVTWGLTCTTELWFY